MKIEEAIKILTSVQNYETCCWMPKVFEARKLGIEALKAWKFMREHSGMSFEYYLQGETE